MTYATETTKFLRETGYPDTVFLHWGIVLNDDNREKASVDLEKVLARFPTLEQNIVKLRYQNFLTLNEISEKLKIPVHTVRKRKNDVLRKIMCMKAGVELYQVYKERK